MKSTCAKEIGAGAAQGGIARRPEAGGTRRGECGAGTGPSRSRSPRSHERGSLLRRPGGEACDGAEGGEIQPRKCRGDRPHPRPPRAPHRTHGAPDALRICQRSASTRAPASIAPGPVGPSVRRWRAGMRETKRAPCVSRSAGVCRTWRRGVRGTGVRVQRAQRSAGILQCLLASPGLLRRAQHAADMTAQRRRHQRTGC